MPSSSLSSPGSRRPSVNGAQLHDAAGGLANIAQQQRGGLAALELARDRVEPRFELTQENSGVDYLGLLDAGSYFSAVDAYGSPAYTPAELATAPEPPGWPPTRSRPPPSGSACTPAARPSPGHACGSIRVPRATFAVPPQGVALTASGPGTQVSLRRYASASFPVALGTLAPGTAELLRIPADRSPRPWSLQLTGGAARHRLPGTRSLTAGELLTPRNARILLGLATGRLRRAAARLAVAPHLSDRRLGPAALAPRVQRSRLLRPARPPSDPRSGAGLQGDPGDHRDGLDRFPTRSPRSSAFLASVLLLFVYLSRRVGDWIALAAVLPVLVMGTAYEDLLTPFQICYFGSMAFGIGRAARDRARRPPRRSDRVRAAGRLARVRGDRVRIRRRRARRDRPAARPAAPRLDRRGPGRALRGLVPRPTGSPTRTPRAPVGAQRRNQPAVRARRLREQHRLAARTWDASRALRVRRPRLGPPATGGPRRPRDRSGCCAGAPRCAAGSSSPLAVGLAFWFITAANFGLGRPPDASRYQYVGAVFVLLIAGELAAGWRPGWRAIAGGVRGRDWRRRSATSRSCTTAIAA